MTALETVTSARFSRRMLLKGAGAAGLGLTLAQVGLLQAVAAQSESVTDIINIASTAEQLAVTLLGGAIDSAAKGGYGANAISAPVLAILQAARAEEKDHLDYLTGAGAKPLTSTFTIPDPKLLTDTKTLFTTIVTLEGAFIAAYMAAAMEFATLNQPGLVKVAYQIGADEAEHRVLANYALGTRPANNVAFEKAMFTNVGGAAAALQQLGFIGGSGTKVTYPGPGTIDASGVTETTPGGPAVDCMPAAAAPAPTPAPSPMPGLPNTGAGGAAGPSVGGLLEMLGLFGVGAAAIGVLGRRFAARAEEQAARDEGEA
ncbi:MAG TPA: ferritin-like domain-containing protein [Thermomicrobiales bacterium]|nr:ferritin-like domain-containing protein [Thermomicrobiales bacterium]